MVWFYAGIGSRRTPAEICLFMTALAGWLEDYGATLRSGGADGADTAFANGVADCDNRIIYRPRKATKEAMAVAERHHPAWYACTEFAKRLHGRNSMIILGPDLQTPVRFVVCWCPDERRGGTALGIKIAKANSIPVYNLYGHLDYTFLYSELLQYLKPSALA